MTMEKQETQEDFSNTSETISDADERELAALGKKSVLRRNFSPIAILGLSCSLVITWEGLFSVFIFGLLNGGPGGLIYGFLFCWAGWAAVVATMGELAVRHSLASPHCIWRVPHGHVAPGPCYQQFAILYSREMAWNLTRVRAHPILLLHITLFVVVLVVMTAKAPTKSSNAEVWTLFLNEGGYESKGLSFFVGLITPVFAFSGADGAVHMSEEIRNSSHVVPWAMITSIAINGLTGFAMLIAMLYCIGDIEAALTTPTGYPFIEILTQGSQSIAGGTALSALLVVMFCCATLGIVPTASRQLWAFARDNAVPNARKVSYVHPRMKVPVVSIAITATITCLLSLINIGSATVFNAIVSLTVAGFFGSYLIPFSLFLYTRSRYPERLVPGPWTLGKWGPFVNGFAILWSLVVMFFSFWPTSVPVAAVNMNWSCVLWSAVMIFAVAFWFVHGRKVYKGPVVETHVEDVVVGTSI
ncbi:Nn.00g015170.m01.CDS01 [Neocucurbitaria sp. VM-36]